MSGSEHMLVIVERLAALAMQGGAAEAARSLSRAAAILREDSDEGARTIIAMYGGSGSLNDVVLYRDGQPLAAENREFDALRSELYDLSLDLRGAA
ncbi:DUF6966 domain-containing protein [Sphingomonas sp. DT-204]|uniref:DUF6966 domain-containing protein n=1 Tax=Sphingomonas sp. DT-204 TaxID=3396166 RepID=UPI003F1E05F6